MSVTNIFELKDKIRSVVQSDKFKILDLKMLLDPLGQYIDTPEFINNIDEVIRILIKDRNNDNKFDLIDLELLGKDPLTIMSLSSSILMILASMPNVKLSYKSGATEELVFRILVYCLLVIIPSNIGRNLTSEEKDKMLDIALSMYQVINSSQAFSGIVSDIKSYFKNRGCCTCAHANKDDVLQKQLPVIKLELSAHVNNVKYKSDTKKQIDELKKSKY